MAAHQAVCEAEVVSVIADRHAYTPVLATATAVVGRNSFTWRMPVAEMPARGSIVAVQITWNDAG